MLALAGASIAFAANPHPVGVAAAGAAPAGSLALFIARPRTVRDLAEARLPIETAIVIADGVLLA